jgi:hypothetical protein
MPTHLNSLSQRLYFDTDEIYCQESTLKFVKFVIQIQFLFTLIQYNAGIFISSGGIKLHRLEMWPVIKPLSFH